MFQQSQQIGPYKLIRRLGRGGFGEVWLGERQGKFATTQVAVKLPLDEQVDHAAIEHEAQTWAKASGHPNVLPIIEADEYDGQIVIVSEYAPDGSLEDWLKTNGKMPIEKAVETTIQILDGLEFLHSRQIIHRDLKPANILLQGKTPRLADFGISRAMRTTVASQSQNISGTFAYMSPEALDGKRSVQTDIWSVGVNLYQFLTGSLPFPQREPSVLFPAIIMREFEPLPDSIPQNLKNIIAKTLAKLPENRYQTTTEMRDDLKKALLSITQPTSAPTEVFQIPPERLPRETNESKVVGEQSAANVPAPTQAALPQASVVTKVNRVSLPEEKSFASQISQPPAKQVNFPLIIATVSAAIIFGLIMWGIIAFSNYRQNKQTPLTAKTASNLSNSTNSNAKVSPTAPLTDEIKIEIKPTADSMAILYRLDGNSAASFNATTTVPFVLTTRKKVSISYYKGFTADKIQMLINGKPIEPPSSPNNGNAIEFEINKDNLTQILQSGKINL